MESYEEKYKKALERALKLRVQNPFDTVSQMMEHIFPELKESEDERIRKSLITFFQRFPYGSLESAGTNPKEAITWLEKQGEQPQGKSALEAVREDEVDNQSCIKPANKVARFEVGEWITNGEYIWKIIEVKPLDYILQSQKDDIIDDTISHVDEQFHSFTIKDARDGDVLMTGDVIFIFNKIHFELVNCHCSLLKDNSFVNRGYDMMHIKYSKEFVYPATKEQSDALFKAMADAGYEWDNELKELKKKR